MFTKITLDNYKSFDHIELDLSGKKGLPKKYAFIYGENGSGKSNLLSSFVFLKQTTCTLLPSFAINYARDTRKIYNDEAANQVERFNSEEMLNTIVKDNRMIGSTKGLKARFDFYINDKHGYYEIEFDSSNDLISEKLYYVVKKGSGYLFNITNESVKINIATSKVYDKELKELIKKYWGKHSFLAIIREQSTKLNTQYLEDNILASAIDVGNFLYSFYASHTDLSYFGDSAISQAYVFKLESGEMPVNYRWWLDVYERALDSYFTSLYSDIKQVYYKREEQPGGIEYRLFVKKLVSGELRDVDFDLESTGTKKLLQLLDPLMSCIIGHTLIYDEMDTGIHDMLMSYIIANTVDQFKGQFIATTHNLSLLEELNPENVYFIQIDRHGFKQVVCAKDIKNVQKNHNMRDLYLKGVWGGVPMPGYFDLEEILKQARQQK